MGRTDLIEEEQNHLNEVIDLLEKALIDYGYKEIEIKKFIEEAKDSLVPEAYGMIAKGTADKIFNSNWEEDIKRCRDDLYNSHVCVLVTKKDNNSSEDIKNLYIGKHGFSNGKDIIIHSWDSPVGQYFVIAGKTDDFPYKGELDKVSASVNYHCLFHNEIEWKCNKVINVIRRYISQDSSAENEDENVITDHFLRTLLERRKETEFSDIIFSIQKKQAKIILFPLNKNLIVQGCAGSGKSMILMHRLPVLLWNNKENLNRHSIRIISPSKTYISMMRSLTKELEIPDIEIQTLNEFYDTKIRSYFVKIDISKYSDKTMDQYDCDTIKNLYSQDTVNKIEVKLEEYIRIENLLSEDARKFADRFDIIMNYEQESTRRRNYQNLIAYETNILNTSNRNKTDASKEIIKVIISMNELALSLKSHIRLILKEKTEQKEIIVRNRTDILRRKEQYKIIDIFNRMLKESDIKVKKINDEINGIEENTLVDGVFNLVGDEISKRAIQIETALKAENITSDYFITLLDSLKKNIDQPELFMKV